MFDVGRVLSTLLQSQCRKRGRAGWLKHDICLSLVTYAVRAQAMRVVQTHTHGRRCARAPLVCASICLAAVLVVSDLTKEGGGTFGTFVRRCRRSTAARNGAGIDHQEEK